MRHVAWIVMALLAGVGCAQPEPRLQIGQPPDSLRIRQLRAESLRQVKEWYRGIPRHVVVDFETADRYLGSGDVSMARSAYRRLIAWFPTGRHRRVADFWLAYCDELLGRRAEAAAGYAAVAAVSPEKGDPWGSEARRRAERLAAP